MTLARRAFLRLAAATAAVPAASRVTAAQSYPTRPITVIVPFAAGGPTDTIARIIAEPMRATLRQPIIIENVAGAAGSVGVGRAVWASADGYTLIAGTLTTHVLEPGWMVRDVQSGNAIEVRYEGAPIH
jgi:tripartite-type tricarboxylate transporter receptor subunit TctC